MSLYEDTVAKIEERIDPDVRVEVLPVGRLAEDPSALQAGILLQNFKTTHLNLMKTYPLTFDYDTKLWVGSPWVIVDLVIPKLNAEPSNIFIHPGLKRRLTEIEARWVIPTRISTDDLYLVKPLVGKPPHEHFQLRSVKEILSRKVFGLFLKQGLGKAYVIATTLRYLFRRKMTDNAIVLTPAIGLIDLKRKILQFAGDTFTDDDILIVTKKNRECFTSDTKDQKIFIMTYSTIRLVRNHYDKKVKPVSVSFRRKFKAWLGDRSGIFIPDEGHNLSNPSSQRAKAAQIIRDACERSIISTGTPADKPEKYYNILKLIDPYFVRYLSYTDWKKATANLGTLQSEYAISEFRPEDLRYFINAASTHYLQILDDDALDLPPHYRKTIPIELEDGKQKKLYELFSSRELEVLKQSHGTLTPRRVLNKFPYLLISLDNPEIIRKKPTTWLTDEGGLDIDTQKLNKLIQSFDFAKDHQALPYLYEILDDHVVERGEKVVVWTGHPDTADTLTPLLKKYNKGVNTLSITGRTKMKGKTSEEVKDAVVQEFLTNPKHRVLVASYLVVETAIDLVEASCQIYFDEPYEMVKFDQSYKRLHRAGQTKPVTTYFLLFANTIDETRHEIVFGKQQIDRGALDSTMPLEEWKKLFTGQVPNSLKADLEEAQELF